MRADTIRQHGDLVLLHHRGMYTVARIWNDAQRVVAVMGPAAGQSLGFASGVLDDPGVLCGWFSKDYATRRFLREVRNGIS